MFLGLLSEQMTLRRCRHLDLSLRHVWGRNMVLGLDFSRVVSLGWIGRLIREFRGGQRSHQPYQLKSRYVYQVSVTQSPTHIMTTYLLSFPSSRYSHSELFASSQRVQTGCLPSHFLFLSPTSVLPITNNK